MTDKLAAWQRTRVTLAQKEQKKTVGQYLYTFFTYVAGVLGTYYLWASEAAVAEWSQTTINVLNYSVVFYMFNHFLTVAIFIPSFVLLVFVIYKAKKVIEEIKEESGESGDFDETFAEACKEHNFDGILEKISTKRNLRFWVFYTWSYVLSLGFFSGLVVSGHPVWATTYLISFFSLKAFAHTLSQMAKEFAEEYLPPSQV